MVIASLPMYDLPELRAATDAWWQGLARAFRRAGLGEVPDGLSRDLGAEAAWRGPGLLFSQTCGYPLTHAFKGVLRLVATPAYAAAGCSGPCYSSAIVVRADDPARELGELAGRICAVNNRASQSGCNALRHAVARYAVQGRFFARVVETGEHLASLTAVAGGRADVAAIDAVTFALVTACRPSAVSGLRILGWSEQAPGLPYVTRADAGADRLARLREGLQAAMDDPALAPAREALLLTGAEPLPAAAYDGIDEMEAEAAARGYPDLA
ncbi:MAG: PhnD/SsuA/transferrin family substrate-binding protein [Rhodospirillales bacterium]|nr:PhnD/SsuA/transferrin family substrate-binding protein [Rhodospirillales bacterium]MDH3910167.1 PhnD/SsuA/transferrin family substrate-binding protein [Rhodospirillales bacterium]MDH3919580.1 PhnD/SsuA/transferrin family substrate-binding protein [Rhodospirillales bacterium]MDH3966371.1 PhnD/SsuA/transferrin family substrate-binding protein [Rhodospirillales bacterium]